MNYPYLIPGQQANTTSFVANATLKLGAYSQAIDAITTISVDYSQLIPAVALGGYSFRVSPGGSPPMWINNSVISGNAMLTFTVSGGIGGQAYEVAINATLADGERRTDILVVNVLGDDNCCNSALSSFGYGSGGGGGTGDGGGGIIDSDGSLIIINDKPRFFVAGLPPVGANVLDRWYETSTGNVYDYITNGVTSYWQLAGGGGGGDGGGGSAANIINMNPIHPDGSSTGFTLTAVGGTPVTISASNTLFVSVDGVWQDCTTQYSAANNRITFTQAPGADSNIFMLWFAPPVANPG